MKTLVLIIFTLATISTANADYLECNNNLETEIEFYNHDGKVTFQLSAPYKDEFLYVLGSCYSENEVGLPYTCEPFDSKVVHLNLISDQNGQPLAELTKSFDDGSIHKELIPCTHFE